MSENKTLGHGGCFPLCLLCKHYHAEKAEDIFNFSCEAFPKKIPSEIWDCKYDHRYRHPDDNGIQFEKFENVEDLSVHVRTRSIKTLDNVFKREIELLEEFRRKGKALPPLEE